MQKFKHISFATSNMYGTQRELIESITNYGIESIEYGENSIDSKYTIDYAHILNNFNCRGGGYWLWKPYIILDQMNKSNEGDVIMYTDAGMCAISDPNQLLCVLDNNWLGLFNMDIPLIKYTKRECFKILGSDTVDYHNLPFVDASVILVKVCKQSRDFMLEYQHHCENDQCLTDIPMDRNIQYPEYMGDHRHDQSILSILSLKYGMTYHRMASQHSQGCEITYNNSPYPQIFNHHRKRSQ